jgi:hypothetical protein
VAELGEATLAVRLVAYVDDIFVIAPTRELCDRALAVLQRYCADIGIVLKAAKMRRPTQVAPVLGWLVDSRSMTVSIPAYKRYNTLIILSVVREAARQGRRVSHMLLDKLLGKLSHTMSIVPQASARLMPLWRAGRRGPAG